MKPVEAIRERVSGAVFARIAGDEGPARRDRIHGAVGPRRFGPTDPIHRVHRDPAMFIGGIRALLLQSLHPLAMAAVDQHSGYRGDPWGRLQRTSTYLAETTFGTIDDADRAIALVRAVHRHIHGVAPDGRSYAASDPRLLLWVHVAQIDSFMRAHDRFAAEPLNSAERDTYVAQAGILARLLGAADVPNSVAELDESLHGFRGELTGTTAARETSRFLLVTPPVPLAQRVPYGMLSAAAVSLLPLWARWQLRLPWVPVTEATVIRAGGLAMVRTIDWMMNPSPS